MFKTILRQLRMESELTQEQLAEKIGLAKSTISMYENGNREPDLETLEAFADFFNVDMNRLTGSNSKDLRFPSPNVAADTGTFPIIGSVAAGYNDIACEDYTGDTIDIPMQYLHGRPQSDYFVLSVHGSSMYPMFLDGDKVLVLRQNTLNHSDQVGVILYNSDVATLKKIRFNENENWLELIPINAEYQSRKIEGEDFADCRILGIPKLLIRDLG